VCFCLLDYDACCWQKCRSSTITIIALPSSLQYSSRKCRLPQRIPLLHQTPNDPSMLLSKRRWAQPLATVEGSPSRRSTTLITLETRSTRTSTVAFIFVGGKVSLANRIKEGTKLVSGFGCQGHSFLVWNVPNGHHRERIFPSF